MLQAGQGGRSALAQKLLGPWASAPRSARADFSRYLQLVARLLGGEASSQEVEVGCNPCPAGHSCPSCAEGSTTACQNPLHIVAMPLKKICIPALMPEWCMQLRLRCCTCRSTPLRRGRPCVARPALRSCSRSLVCAPPRSSSPSGEPLWQHVSFLEDPGPLVNTELQQGWCVSTAASLGCMNANLNCVHTNIHAVLDQKSFTLFPQADARGVTGRLWSNDRALWGL